MDLSRHTAPPDVLDMVRCPACRHRGRLVPNGGRRLKCPDCAAEYPVDRGYLDLCPDLTGTLTPIQKLCQFPPMIAVYDSVWRPFGYFLTSSRSFPKDMERITAMMAPARHDRVLDLACGPGNFTRSIARQGPDTIVVGFDLAAEMLSRAVGLSRAPEYDNVRYLRGSALDLPFDAGAFDAVVCCAALQLFTDRDRALSEIARVLKPGGEFICQTVITPGRTPLWLRMADRLLRFGYFRRDDLRSQLDGLGMEIRDEESSRLSYIFVAAKREPESAPAAG